MNTKHEFWARKKELNEDFFISGSVTSPATDELIEVYEISSGYIFSDDVKDFLRTFGSLQFEVKEEVWKRPAVGEVVTAWKLGYGFFIYGLCPNDEMPARMGYEENNNKVLEATEKPLGQLFFRRSGYRYRAYTHNAVISVEYGRDGGDLETFDGNIYDFLIDQINVLEADYLKYIQGN